MLARDRASEPAPDQFAKEQPVNDRSPSGGKQEDRLESGTEVGPEDGPRPGERQKRQPRFVAKRVKGAVKPQAPASDPKEQKAPREIATDFIPLMYGGASGALDSGQVVRVELPRSALVSFGLPMNLERANERIKADVVIGSDGLARAIRFVR